MLSYAFLGWAAGLIALFVGKWRWLQVLNERKPSTLGAVSSRWSGSLWRTISLIATTIGSFTWGYFGALSLTQSSVFGQRECVYFFLMIAFRWLMSLWLAYSVHRRLLAQGVDGGTVSQSHGPKRIPYHQLAARVAGLVDSILDSSGFETLRGVMLVVPPDGNLYATSHVASPTPSDIIIPLGALASINQLGNSAVMQGAPIRHMLVDQVATEALNEYARQGGRFDEAFEQMLAKVSAET